jgi:hypothetical protein
VSLGDPYSINIPVSLIKEGNNTINITTGLSLANSSSGSLNNSVIYTMISNISTYSSILKYTEGCIWTVEYEDGSQSVISVPLSYSGAQACSYTGATGGIGIYDPNNAVSEAVVKLFRILDPELNGKINIKLSDQDFQISSSTITGIPYTEATEVQIRKWR